MSKEKYFRVRTGGPFDFVTEPLSDAVDAAGDLVASAWDVIDDVPGFKQLGDGTKAVFTGPLRDFAKTTVGQVVIRALSTSLMGASFALPGMLPAAVSSALGPPLAVAASQISMAMPSMVRGEKFWKAYFQEGLWRVKTTAEILGAKKILELAGVDVSKGLNEVQRVLDKTFLPLQQMTMKAALATGKNFSDFISPEALASKLGISSLSVEALAKRFGIQDINAAILQHYLYPEKWPNFPSASSFDPISGKQKAGRRLVEVPLSTGPKTVNPCDSYRDAVRMKMPAPVIATLKAKCESAKRMASTAPSLLKFNTQKPSFETFTPGIVEPEETPVKKWLVIGGVVVLGLGGLIWWRKRL